MKDLPRVYVNPIEKKLKNYQEIATNQDRCIVSKKNNLLVKIKQIFSSNNYVYKKRVRLTFKDSVKEKIIVGKAQGYLLTIDGEKIKLSDIYDIEVI